VILLMACRLRLCRESERRLEDSYRLFTVPGLFQWSGGDGPNNLIQSVQFEEWVEPGKRRTRPWPPDGAVGESIGRGCFARTRRSEDTKALGASTMR